MRHTKSVTVRVIYLTMLFLIYSSMLRMTGLSINTAAYGLFVLMSLGYYLTDTLNFNKIKYKMGDFVYTAVINLLIFMMFFMFYKEGRFVVIYPIYTAIQSAIRYILLRVLARVKRVIVLGNNGRKREIEELLMEDENYKYLGFVGNEEGALGSVEGIKDIIKEKRVDKIIITEEFNTEEDVKRILQLKLLGVIISDYLNFMEEVEGKISVKEIDREWILKSRGFGILNNDLQKRIKRFFDLSLVFLIGIFALPLMIGTAFIMKVSGAIDKKTAGPLFFKQMRIGLGNQPFEIIKFRTMITKEHWTAVGFDPEKESWTEAGDPRITKMGNFMRKTRVDELPQLLNVFRGEMSFVGPRPESVSYVDVLEEELPFYSLRHTVIPGLTGWAQVMYPYGASVEDALHKLEYDLYYIKHQNFIMDLMIFFKTVKTVVFGRGR